MEINSQEAAVNKGEIEFKKRDVLLYDNGSPAVRESWMEKDGSQYGSRTLYAFDTLGEVVHTEHIEGRGGGLIDSDSTSTVTKVEKDLPVEIYQVEHTPSVVEQSLTTGDYVKNVSQAGYFRELVTDKTRLVWNHETKQLFRVVKYENGRQTPKGETYETVNETRFSYDEKGRMTRRTEVEFNEIGSSKVSRVEEFEFTEIAGEDRMQLRVSKDFRPSFLDHSKELTLYLVHAAVVDTKKAEFSKKWVATGSYANTVSGPILGGTVDFVDKNSGDTLKLVTHSYDRKERVDLLPKTLTVKDFSPKKVDD